MWLFVCEYDQIESKMSEEERGDSTFFPEHLHVLREKLEGNRKRAHGRSVGELPGRSRKRADKKQTQSSNGKQLPCVCMVVLCCFFPCVLGCNTATARTSAADTREETRELANKLKRMEEENGAMMKQVRRQRIGSVSVCALRCFAAAGRAECVRLASAADARYDD